MFALTLIIALQAAAPSAEAETLGRRLAESGTLSALLPLMIGKETEELVAAHPELTEAEKSDLRAIARGQAKLSVDRVMMAEGHSLAAALSIEDLRVLVAAAEGGPAKRQRAALPKVIAASVQAAGGADLQHDTLAAFCKKTGKACPK